MLALRKPITHDLILAAPAVCSLHVTLFPTSSRYRNGNLSATFFITIRPASFRMPPSAPTLEAPPLMAEGACLTLAAGILEIPVITLAVAGGGLLCRFPVDELLLVCNAALSRSSACRSASCRCLSCSCSCSRICCLRICSNSSCCCWNNAASVKQGRKK